MTNEDVFQEVQRKRWKTCTHLYRASNVQMENGSIQERQNQCIAYGDGEIYVKITPESCYNRRYAACEDCSKIDFRDPKVCGKKENYYLIVGNKNSEQKGQVVLFPVKI